MSAQTLDKISGLVALNSLMAMVGGTLVALVLGKNDPASSITARSAGLVAVCAGSDLMHPIGALVVGGVAGGPVRGHVHLTQNRWKIDDVLGVWPLHGLCGAWGGIAAGIFGSQRPGRRRRRRLHADRDGRGGRPDRQHRRLWRPENTLACASIRKRKTQGPTSASIK